MTILMISTANSAKARIVINRMRQSVAELDLRLIRRLLWSKNFLSNQKMSQADFRISMSFVFSNHWNGFFR